LTLACLKCHLPKSTSETFIVHQTSDGKPFSLDYFISPIPHDGSCPQTKTGSKFRQISNTTLSVHSPKLPPLYGHLVVQNFPNADFCFMCRPELRKPPPLTPQGEPVQPAPEQSFIQKYWIYGLVALGALRECHVHLI
jgi:ER membrane protein complex subunit 10